jgi:uncharacterized membrane protein
MPTAAKRAEDVDFHRLALKYELTGGFIKNAILIAISEAVTRSKDTDDIVITQKVNNQYTIPSLSFSFFFLLLFFLFLLFLFLLLDV